MELSRLSFLKLALGAGTGSLAPRCMAKPKDVGSTYSVALLGDTHFDSTDNKFYHAKYLSSTTEQRYKAHLKEHVRNAKMWTERMPSLLRASARSATPDTAFILQMGDLVQGDCNDPAMHRRMLTDAFNLIKGAYGGGLPFVSVVGNHDIRGDIPTDGTREAFDAWQPPVVSGELKQSVAGTTFSFRHGPDAFVVVDFNDPRPDFDLLLKVLDGTDGARHLFLVSHGPAIPNGASRWFLLGGKDRTEERRELLRRLAKRNAIVLSGHTHKIEYYDCVLPEGRVTQFVASSVWSNPDLDKLKFVDKGVADYGNRVKKLKSPQRDGVTPKDLAELVEEYRPYIRDYSLANGAGHFRLDISDKCVAATFYGGASLVPGRTYLLRG